MAKAQAYTRTMEIMVIPMLPFMISERVTTDTPAGTAESMTQPYHNEVSFMNSRPIRRADPVQMTKQHTREMIFSTLFCFR